MTDSTEWVVLDTETDGLYYPINIVEIAAQRMVGTTPIGTPFQVLINHNVPIAPEAVAIHGYTNKFLATHGVNPVEAYGRLCDYVGDRFVTAHCLRFDWDQALAPEWGRLSIPPVGKRGFCFWLLARRVVTEMPSHRLDALRDRFALKCCRPHSALGDVESVCDLFLRVMRPRLRKAGIEGYEAVSKFLQMVPLARCICLIEGRNWETEKVKYLEAKQRAVENRRLAMLLDIGDVADVPKLMLERGLVEESHTVEFENRIFLFTGKMKWGARSKVQALVQKLGGRLAKSKAVSREVNYLILGEDHEAGWTTLLGGGKLIGALKQRLLYPESRLRLVLETDFVHSANERLTGSRNGCDDLRKQGDGLLP
jgi:DNA polymerase III epsilon subunit-like protein